MDKSSPKNFQNQEEQNHPLVGVGVMIFRDNQILLAKRRTSLGKGEYAFPGGHLEYMETIEECAKRETFEEAGIEIKNINFQCLANIRKYKPRHYIHIGVVAEYKKGKVQNKEPHKIEAWNWYPLKMTKTNKVDFRKLPTPLFNMTKLGIISYYTNRVYFSSS